MCYFDKADLLSLFYSCIFWIMGQLHVNETSKEGKGIFMFSTIRSNTNSKLSITIDGERLEVPEGITVAAALLGHKQEKDCRCSFVSGEKRAPYCFMGVCHECILEIDNRPNQKACNTQVKEGMKIRKQNVREGE